MQPRRDDNHHKASKMEMKQDLTKTALCWTSEENKDRPKINWRRPGKAELAKKQYT